MGKRGGYESAREAMSRAHRTGDPRSVEEAVRRLRGVIADAPDDDPSRGKYLADLGVALRWRFERTGDPADADAALHASADAVRVTPAHDPDRIDYFNSLVNALWARYSRSGVLEHLDEGVRVCQDALAAAPAGHPVRAMLLSGMGSALRARHARTGRLTDLDAAIRAGARAVDADPDEPEYLADLLTTLRASPPVGQDLDSVIRALHWAVHSTPRDHPEQARNLYDLAEALERRFARTASPDDLDDLIRVVRRAVALDPRVEWLAGLGGWLVRTGSPSDLDEAVRVTGEALRMTEPHDPARASALSNLGTALRLRFEHTDAMADLDQAVQFSADAVRATASDAAERPVVLSSLAITLVLRFGRTGAAADLDEAVRVHTEAAATIARDAAERPGVLAALALALALRFDRTEVTADIDQAVRVGTEAAAAEHPFHAGILANLAQALRARHGHTGDPADLERAVAVASDAVAMTPADHPERARRLVVLGHTLAYRFERTGEQPDGRRAADAFGEVLRLDGVAPFLRAGAAQRLGRLHALAGGWPDAARYHAAAVGLLPTLASRQATRDAQEHRLGARAGLASDAAACALANGDAEQAVELLEAGRGVLLSQALETRTDVTDLRAEAPRLAERFEFLRRRLDRVPDPASPERESRRELAAEFDRLVLEIRRTPGFQRFLLPVPVAELAQETVEGPVVLVNVSDYRCDALILTPYGVRAVPLPALTRDLVREQADGFLAALATCQDPSAGIVDRQRAQESIVDQLEWLWDNVTEPVLTALGHTAPPAPGGPWPRVWWSPTGPLTALPLHAAGHHRDPESGRAVLDRVVSSYTPTIGVLRHHRRPRPRPAPRALVVAMPRTPGGAELPGAQREHDLLAGVLGGVTSVVGEAATHRRVTAELPTHTVAHFACHGVSDLANPSDSGVLLQDHPLRILDVARLDLTAELAYLSACDTARTGARLADEAIHLAGAFQLAGYANVVATLWTIADDLAVSIAQDFHGHFARSRHAALALHETVNRARRRYPRTPTMWAAHIHSGG